jgi:hypothetical protein
MKRTLVFQRIGSMVVLRENNETPMDAEWDAFLDLLKQNREQFAKFKVLVVTDGGGPSAPQRKRLENTLSGRPVRVAVVTDSAKSRFIASAISLINRDHRGFATAEIKQAYAHLGMTPDECHQAEKVLKEMDPQIR